jgi:excisionase family DNA binding protein
MERAILIAMQRRAVYVRLPEPAADKLDRVAFERKVSKQDLIAGLVDRHLVDGQVGEGSGHGAEGDAHVGEGNGLTVGEGNGLAVEEGNGLTVGRHEFRPAPAAPAAPGDVLTAAEVADLLRTTEDAVLELAEAGELPGRRLAGEWRFARAAVLRWLGRG